MTITLTQVTKTALYVQNKNSPTHFTDRTYRLDLIQPVRRQHRTPVTLNMSKLTENRITRLFQHSCTIYSQVMQFIRSAPESHSIPFKNTCLTLRFYTALSLSAGDYSGSLVLTDKSRKDIKNFCKTVISKKDSFKIPGINWNLWD